MLSSTVLKIRFKIQENLHQIYKRQEIKKHYLQYLFIEITKRCNLNCLHCGSDCSKQTQSAELTTESWLKIIDYIKHTLSESVALVITGGEPLMHPDLIHIGQHISKNKMRWGMVTNGMLLSRQTMHNLLEAGMSSITLSVDGLKENHNWLRNHVKAFDTTFEALKLIGLAKIPFKDVVTCVSPKNLSELDEIAHLLIENEIKDWRLFRIFPSGRAKNDPLLQLSFEQTQGLIKWISDNKSDYLKKGLNINLSCEGWIPFEYDQKVRDYPFFCRAGINIASVLSDGTITGCSNNHKSFHVGNILHDNFAGLWQNKFEIFRERNWLSQTYCNDCEYIKNCNGSSIHLWELGNRKPNFCYAVDIKKD